MVFVIVGVILYFLYFIWSFSMACVFDSLGLAFWKAFVPIYRWDVIYHKLFGAKGSSRSFPQIAFYLSLIFLFILNTPGILNLGADPLYNIVEAVILFPFVWLAICLTFVFGVIVLVCTCEIDAQVARLYGIAHYGLFSVGMFLLPFVFWPILSLKYNNEQAFDETL